MTCSKVIKEFLVLFQVYSKTSAKINLPIYIYFVVYIGDTILVVVVLVCMSLYRLVCMGLQSGLHGSTVWSAWVYSLVCMGLYSLVCMGSI